MEISKNNATQILEQLKAGYLELRFPISEVYEEKNSLSFVSQFNFKGRDLSLEIVVFYNQLPNSVIISILNAQFPPKKSEVVSDLINRINLQLYLCRIGIVTYKGFSILETNIDLENGSVIKQLFHKKIIHLLWDSYFYGNLIDKLISSGRTPKSLWGEFLANGKNRELEKVKKENPELIIIEPIVNKIPQKKHETIIYNF
jgi:hypothetical protein